MAGAPVPVPVRVCPPRRGFVQPADPADIVEVLTFFGPTAAYGLRGIELRQQPASGAKCCRGATPIDTIEPLIDMVDLILVMSVNPGFGGQTFVPFAVEKLARLRALVGIRPIELEVDGGITAETAPLVARAGANVLVAGSAVFGGKPDKYGANIDAIRNAAAFARGEAA